MVSKFSSVKVLAPQGLILESCELFGSLDEMQMIRIMDRLCLDAIERGFLMWAQVWLYGKKFGIAVLNLILWDELLIELW